eukprot:SAG11_NODE_32326_length_284_cov_1.270270_1_plen_71_part_10
MTAAIIPTQATASVALPRHDARRIDCVAKIMLAGHDPARDRQRTSIPIPSISAAWCFDFGRRDAVENCRGA